MLIEGTRFSLLAEGELEAGIDSHTGEACLIAADLEEISPSREGEPPHSSLHLSLVLSTMAILRAGLNPPSAEPAEHGQRGRPPTVSRWKRPRDLQDGAGEEGGVTGAPSKRDGASTCHLQLKGTGA